jgi:hypothetical protein
MYLQSQTSISIISNANLALFLAPGQTVPAPATDIAESLQSEILTGYQTSMCRDFINSLAGSRRAFAHAASPYPGGEFQQWRLDDEVIAYPTYAVINANRRQLREHPGFLNICIHKGLSASGTQPGGVNNTPDYGNPDDIVKAATDWPQFNWIIYHSCFRPSFWALQALLDIENAAGSMAPTTITDSDGHTVPNIRWSTQFAQICGGKYVAGAEPTSTSPSSPFPLRNVYTELGTTMASMIVTFPTAWAHLIGQQLYYMGSRAHRVRVGLALVRRAAVAGRGPVAVPDPRLEQRAALRPVRPAGGGGWRAGEPIPAGQPDGLRTPDAAGQPHRHGAGGARLSDPDHAGRLGLGLGRPDP